MRSNCYSNLEDLIENDRSRFLHNYEGVFPDGTVTIVASIELYLTLYSKVEWSLHAFELSLHKNYISTLIIN